MMRTVRYIDRLAGIISVSGRWTAAVGFDPSPRSTTKGAKPFTLTVFDRPISSIGQERQRLGIAPHHPNPKQALVCCF